MSQHWSAEENPNYQDDDYMSGHIIRYDPTPGGRKNADGTTTHSMNFPALVITRWVGEPSKAAQEIAAALNSADAKDKRIAELEALIAAAPAPNPSPAAKSGEAEALKLVRTAFVQARGALRLDAMVDREGKPYGTTVEALRAIAEAEDALADVATPSPQPADAVREALREIASLPMFPYSALVMQGIALAALTEPAPAGEAVGPVASYQKNALGSDTLFWLSRAVRDKMPNNGSLYAHPAPEDTARLREDLERAAKDLRAQTLREGALRERDNLFERASKDRMVGAAVAAQWLRSHGAMTHKERAASTPLNIVEAARLGEDGWSAFEKGISLVEKLWEEHAREHGIYDPSTNATEFRGSAEDMDCMLQEILDGMKAIRAARSASREATR